MLGETLLLAQSREILPDDPAHVHRCDVRGIENPSIFSLLNKADWVWETVVWQIRQIAPSDGVTTYDRTHLMTYAELLDADARGVTWQQAAFDILGIDPEADTETARVCWDSHLARARWIVREGLAPAVEAFGHNPHG